MSYSTRQTLDSPFYLPVATTHRRPKNPFPSVQVFLYFGIESSHKPYSTSRTQQKLANLCLHSKSRSFGSISSCRIACAPQPLCYRCTAWRTSYSHHYRHSCSWLLPSILLNSTLRYSILFDSLVRSARQPSVSLPGQSVGLAVSSTSASCCRAMP